MQAKKPKPGLWRRVSNPIRRRWRELQLSRKIGRLSKDAENLRQESAAKRQELHNGMRNMTVDEVFRRRQEIMSLESQLRIKNTEIKKQRMAFKENIESGYIS